MRKIPHYLLGFVLAVCVLAVGGPGLGALFGARARQTNAAQERQLKVVVGATPAEAATNRQPQLWGVIIGISRYQHGGQNFDGTQINNLNYAVEDARAVYDFLRSDEGGGFRDVQENGHLILLTDEQATKANVERALATLKATQPNDYFILYIAAHGVLLPQLDASTRMTVEMPYFVMYDTDPREPDSLQRTALKMEAFPQALKTIPARKGLLLSDTCHSAGVSMMGRAGLAGTRAQSRFITELSRIPEGIGIIAAADQTEVSLERANLGHGVFTWALLEGLRGHADFDQNRMVTFGELKRYLATQVPQLTSDRQHPYANTSTIEANQIPLASVRYAETEPLDQPHQFGTLIIRAPELDGVMASVDGAPPKVLNSNTESTWKLRNGIHQLLFQHGAQQQSAQATITPGESLFYEVNLVFSESGADALVENNRSQVNVYLSGTGAPGKEAKDWFVKGVESFDKQQFAEALGYLNRALQANGGAYAHALVYRGRAQQALGLQREAIASLQQALAQQPSDYETRTLLAEARFSAGDNVEAVAKELQEIIARHPNDGYARLVYGDLLFLRGDLIGAERQLRRAIRNQPASPPAHMILADVLMDLGARELEQTRKLSQVQLPNNPGNPGNPKLGEAIAEAEQALQLFDKLSRKRVKAATGLKRLSISHVIFAGARYANKAALAEAQHVLARALARAVEYDEALSNPQSYLSRARQAIEAAAALAKTPPRDPLRALLVMETSARIYLLAGQAERSIAEAERALKLAQQMPGLEDFADAHYTLYSAFKSNPQSARAAARAAEHLQKYLSATRAKLGLLARQSLEEELSSLQREASARKQLK